MPPESAEPSQPKDVWSSASEPTSPAWQAPSTTSTTPKSRKAAEPRGSKRGYMLSVSRAASLIMSGIPGRLPDEIDARRRSMPGVASHLLLAPRAGSDLGDRAHRRSQRHGACVATPLGSRTFDVVDQAELVDVDRDLRVVAGLDRGSIDGRRAAARAFVVSLGVPGGEVASDITSVVSIRSLPAVRSARARRSGCARPALAHLTRIG